MFVVIFVVVVVVIIIVVIVVVCNLFLTDESLSPLAPAGPGGDVRWSLQREQCIAAVQGKHVVIWDVRAPERRVSAVVAAKSDSDVTSVDWSPRCVWFALK